MLLLLACDLGPVPDEVSDPHEGRADDTAPDDTAPDDTAAPDDTGDTDPAPDTDTDTGPIGTDADGDGVSVEAGDCNDGNPWVYPGAEEWCDPVDHDCDGEPLAPGVCGKDQQAQALWTTSWTPDAAWADDGVYVSFGSPAGFVGDLDGDGKSEILTGCDNCSWFTEGRGGSNAYVLPGGTVGRDLEPTSAALGWWRGSEGYVPGVVMDLGDWNGDGVSDMAMNTGEGGGQSGVVRILCGPPSRWPSGVDASAAADVRFYSNGYDGFGGMALTNGDFDGDGLSDIAATSYQGEWGSSPSGIWLLRGRTDSEADPDLNDERRLNLPSDSVAYEALSPGDLDGDGADDLVVMESNGDRVATWVVPGDAFAELGAAVSDVAISQFTMEWQSNCLAAPGDLDHDGLGDWVVGLSSLSSTHDDPGALYAVSGAHRNSGAAETFPEAAEGWWAGTLDRAVGFQCGAGDVDGDAGPELLVLRADIDTYRSTVYQWAVVRMAGMPAPGDPLPTSLPIARPDDWRSLQMSQVPSIRDYDGDGFNDILLSGYHHSDALGMGGFVIIPGWEIPWDDPSYW